MNHSARNPFLVQCVKEHRAKLSRAAADFARPGRPGVRPPAVPAAVQAALDDARAKVRREAAEIAQLCISAGAEVRIGEFIASGKSVDEVRQTLASASWKKAIDRVNAESSGRRLVKK